MKIVAIIQARMGSTRLPGKVMRDLCGRTVLAHVIQRLKASNRINAIVVATTMAASDDAIVAEAQRNGVAAFRGSEDDVLQRYYQAAESVAADVVVRITSDCPLIDPELLDRMIDEYLSADVDYLSNTLERSYPRGLDAEIFSFAALAKTWQQAQQGFEREHVTPYIYHNPEIFRLKSYIGETDLSAHRWTLDTSDDWNLIEAIYQRLYRADTKPFSTAVVLQLLQEQPKLVALNAHVEQKKLGA